MPPQMPLQMQSSAMTTTTAMRNNSNGTAAPPPPPGASRSKTYALAAASAASAPSSSLPALHQVVALALSYQRIVSRWLFFPRAVLLAQAALWVGFIVLNGIAGGWGVVALLLWGVLFLSANGCIRELATSKASLDAAYQKNEVRLPVVAAAVSCGVARWVIGPFLERIGLADLLSWSSPAGWAAVLYTVRLACASALLGLAVVIRYMGPQSIMRCSCVPLALNPFDDAVQSILDSPASIVAPSDRPGELLSLQIPGYGSSSAATAAATAAAAVGGRYKHATYKSMLSQLVASAAIGFVLGVGTVVGWFPGGVHPQQQQEHREGGDNVVMMTNAATVLCCFLTVAGALGFGSALFPDHELDPERYSSKALDSILSRSPSPLSFIGTILQWKPVVFAVAIPLVSLIAAFLMVSIGSRSGTDDTGEEEEAAAAAAAAAHIVHTYYWRLFVRLILHSGCVSAYLYVLDEAIKFALFEPALETLKCLVEQFYDDPTPLTRLDVAMHSLLFSNTSFVKDLSSPLTSAAATATSSGVWLLEEEERRRLDDYSKRLAVVMLSPRPSPTVAGATSNSSSVSLAGEAPLEEDVLRVAVLESLVDTTGSLSSATTKQQATPNTTTRRRKQQPRSFVDELVDPKSPIVGGEGGKQRWYLCVPLVRALCVYVAGIGEALSLVCSSGTNKKTPANMSSPLPAASTLLSSIIVRWSLPPGLYFCAERAVVSISRCIVQSMTTPEGAPIPDWKSSDLSILVPAALSSIFYLKHGIEVFAKVHRSSSETSHIGETPGAVTSIATTMSRHADPRDLSLMKTCDTVGKEILACLMLPKASAGRFDLGLDLQSLGEACNLWVKGLVYPDSSY